MFDSKASREVNAGEPFSGAIEVNQKSKTVFLYSAVGFGVGWVMASPFWLPAVGSMLGKSFLGRVWEYLNAPAHFVARLFEVGFSEWMAWFAIPIMMLVAQWTLVGLVVGLWRRRKS